MHIVAEIFSLDNLYLAGKTPLLVGDMLVSFREILQKQAKVVHAGVWVGIPT